MYRIVMVQIRGSVIITGYDFIGADQSQCSIYFAGSDSLVGPLISLHETLRFSPILKQARPAGRLVTI